MSSCNNDDIIDSEMTLEPYGKEMRYLGRIVAATIFPSNNQRMLALQEGGPEGKIISEYTFIVVTNRDE